MYITIDETNYLDIRNLTFNPQTNMTGDQLPINEFEVDVRTSDVISYGQWVYLYDDMNNLWAYYYIVYVQPEGDMQHIRARSPLELMEQIVLPEQYYSGVPLDDVLDDTFNSIGAGYTVGIDYTVAPALLGYTVTGYCPEQNARERLQWVAFAVGAYVRTYGSATVDILPIALDPLLIPREKTYMRPKVAHSDTVSALTLTRYEFQQVFEPQNSSLYTYKFPPTLEVTEQKIQLVNPQHAVGARKNEVEIDGIYLITAANSQSILNLLGRRYFFNTSIDVDVIDNAEYWPGMSVKVYTHEGILYSGFIESASFSFGKQAKASLHLVACEIPSTVPISMIGTIIGNNLGLSFNSDLPSDFWNDFEPQDVPYQKTGDDGYYLSPNTYSKIVDYLSKKDAFAGDYYKYGDIPYMILPAGTYTSDDGKNSISAVADIYIIAAMEKRDGKPEVLPFPSVVDWPYTNLYAYNQIRVLTFTLNASDYIRCKSGLKGGYNSATSGLVRKPAGLGLYDVSDETMYTNYETFESLTIVNIPGILALPWCWYDDLPHDLDTLKAIVQQGEPAVGCKGVTHVGDVPYLTYSKGSLYNEVKEQFPELFLNNINYGGGEYIYVNM